MKIATSNLGCCQQTRYIIFGQLIIIAMLDMSDPYWPLIIASYHTFHPKILQYWSGAIYMAPLLTTIFTTLMWTKIGERVGFKKMILRSGIALAATQWALIFLKNPWEILLIRLLQGALAGFTAAAQAWSLKMTPIQAHSRVVGRLQAATAMGSIVGPICGGLVSHYYGYLSIFFTAGCMCLLITLILAHYLQENPTQSLEVIAKKKQKDFFLHETGKNLLLLLICGTQIARWMSTPFFALYMAQQLHADNVALGLIYACMALSMSLMTLTVGKAIDKQFSWHAWAKLLLIMALILSGLSQWGLAFITKLYLAFGLSILWGLSLGVIAIILFSFLLGDISDSNRAKAVGLGNTALKLGNLLGIITGTFIQAESMQVDGHFMVSFMVIGFFYLVLAIIAGHYK